MDTKPAIASVTIWGIILSAICTSFPSVASALHLTDPATQSAIVTFVGTFGTLISLGIALYGRFHTSAGIAGLLKTPSAPTSSGGGTPPAAANIFIVAFCIGAMILFGAPMLVACSTTSASSGTSSAATLYLNEGKALTAGYQAADALAVSLDGAAKSGALTGSNAVTARHALIGLQTGLAAASAAYGQSGATTPQQIQALAALLQSAASAVPMNSDTSALVQAAITLATAFATTVD